MIDPLGREPHPDQRDALHQHPAQRSRDHERFPGLHEGEASESGKLTMPLSPE